MFCIIDCRNTYGGLFSNFNFFNTIDKWISVLVFCIKPPMELSKFFEHLHKIQENADIPFVVLTEKLLVFGEETKHIEVGVAQESEPACFVSQMFQRFLD